MQIAIIIPAYNEELTISKTIEDFFKQLPEAAFYVINNNSTDRTKEIAQKTFNSLKCKTYVILDEPQKGKSFAIKKAFAEIEADVYVMVDADQTYPAADINLLLEPVLSQQADMTVGDRLSQQKYQKQNKRAFHVFGNTLVKKIINTLFFAQLNDIMSGYRVFSRKFVKNFPILTKGFELETEMTLHALDKNFKIAEIPINYQDRPQGSVSKLNTFTDGFKVLSIIVQIFKDYHPLLFFGWLAGLAALAGLVTGAPVIVEYLQTGLVPRFPTAILATGIMILSILFLAIGLILDTVVHNHRYDYEWKLLNYHR
ncbi:glycosyltransferase family 2 protein [Candidatus Margulisiibacteriota bacterium]